MRELRLSEVPEDIEKIINEKHTEEKENCDCVRSKKWTVYKIVREWEQFRKNQNSKKGSE